MHPFISQLQNQQSAWTPPPPVKDTDWQTAFDSAPEETKANIANSWLWCFNNEWRTQQALGQRRWFANYYEMYVKVGPYIDIAKHNKFGLCGRFEDLLQLNRNGTWEGVSEATASYFITQFRNCWYDVTADKREAFEKILTALEAYSFEEMKPIKAFVPILFNVMWDEVPKHSDEEHFWIECATRISLVAGLNAMGFETVPDSCSINHPDGFGWFKLSQSTKVRTGFSYDAQLRERVLAAAHSCPPDVALRNLNKLFAVAVEKKTDTISWVRERTLFNPSQQPIDDVYGVLRTWAPSYTKIWDSAEALGIHYTEAIEQAMTYQPKMAASETLPSNFDTSTLLGH